MPEKEISSDQKINAVRWIKEVKDGQLVVPTSNRNDFIDGVYNVEGVPFVIYSRSILASKLHENGEIERSLVDPRFFVFCIEDHARALEQAGIINFSQPELPGAQTP